MYVSCVTAGLTFAVTVAVRKPWVTVGNALWKMWVGCAFEITTVERDDSEDERTFDNQSSGIWDSGGSPGTHWWKCPNLETPSMAKGFLWPIKEIAKSLSHDLKVWQKKVSGVSQRKRTENFWSKSRSIPGRKTNVDNERKTSPSGKWLGWPWTDSKDNP